jgi:CRP-like cAMP-binding protein
MNDKSHREARGAGDWIHADYSRILCGGAADVIRLASDEPTGMPGAPIDPASEDGQRLERLTTLMRGFSPADATEALELATHLEAHPAERARWLERLGEALGKLPGFEPLAFACVANATAAFDAIGDIDGKQRCGAAMLTFKRDDAWMSYARKMIAQRDSRPGEDLASIVECAGYAQLSETTLAELTRLAGTPRHYPHGDYLCVEGLRADKVFFLKRGRVAILHEIDRTERFLRFRHPGEAIGDMGLTTGDQRRTASCLAVEPTEAWVIDYKPLRELRDDPRCSDLRQLLERTYVERRIETRLLQHPVTARLDIAERVRLAELVETGGNAPMRLAPQQQLAGKASAVEHVFLLLDGTIHLARSIERGSEPAIKTDAKRGYFLGLPALFGNVHWPSDVVAGTDGWVARIPVAALRDFAASRPALREAVAEALIASPSGRALAS